MSILMIGLVSAAAATTRMHDLRRQNRERTVAQNAVRSIAERIHAQSYRLSEDPATWAAGLVGIFGPDGSFGTTFDVDPLNREFEFVPVGSIEIVTSETLSDVDLDCDLGMPRDLNADGDATDVDVTGSALLLPVIVNVSWTGISGRQSIRHGFYVMGY